MNARGDSHNGAAYSTFGLHWLAQGLIPCSCYEEMTNPVLPSQ